MKEKTVIFLSDSLVLTDEELELIEKCHENEIIVLTYSRIEDKKVDVDKALRRRGLKAEYKRVRRSDSIMGLMNELNTECGLQIDVTFACPLHAMEITPYGYLPENRITTLEKGEMVEHRRTYLDYGALNSKERKIVETIGKESLTVKMIAEMWAVERKEKSSDFVHIPDERKTIHRVIKGLLTRGYVSSRKKEDDPYDTDEYFLDENQQFMLRLTGYRKTT